MRHAPFAPLSPSLSSELVEVVQPVVVGRLGQAYGIKGWLKLQSFTAPEDNIFKYAPWYIKHSRGYEPITITEFKPHSKGFVIHLSHCNDRTTAQTLVGFDIVIEQKQLPLLKEGEFYLVELEGMEVKTTTGLLLGTLSYFLPVGDTEVMVIEGEKQHLVPFLMDHFVKDINKKEKYIIVDWDPGL